MSRQPPHLALSRRAFGLLAGACLVGGPSIGRSEAVAAEQTIIAEGGAAQERIGDTRGAFDLAIAEGCDFIQASFAPSKEGTLVARRTPELSAGTDVASHPEFADRKTTRTVGGQALTGWFAEDFTVAELQTLSCREPDPVNNPQTMRYDGREPILTLGDVLRIARDGCTRTGRTIGVCARLLRPAYYAGLGFDTVEQLATELGIEGYRAAAAAVWMQCAEPDALAAFGKRSPIRRMLVLGGEANGKASEMLTPQGLGAIRAYAEAIAPDQDLMLNLAATQYPTVLTTAADAHTAGLKVFARATRGETSVPPAMRDQDWRSASFRSGDGDLDRLLVALYSTGADGVATSLPAPAAKARTAVAEALQRERDRRRSQTHETYRF